MLAKRLCAAMVRYISVTFPEKDGEELDLIEYGLEGILMTIPKTIFIFTIAYFLDVFLPLLLSVFFFGLLRTFASGVHLKNSWTCLFFSSCVLFSITYAGIYIPMTLGIKAIMFLVAFVLLFKYAPADTEERPLVVPRIRRELKVYSLIVTGLMFIATMVLPGNHMVGNIIAWSVVTESVMTTPMVYFLLNRRYKNYEDYES